MQPMHRVTKISTNSSEPVIPSICVDTITITTTILCCRSLTKMMSRPVKCTLVFLVGISAQIFAVGLKVNRRVENLHHFVSKPKEFLGVAKHFFKEDVSYGLSYKHHYLVKSLLYPNQVWCDIRMQCVPL